MPDSISFSYSVNEQDRLRLHRLSIKLTRWWLIVWTAVCIAAGLGTGYGVSKAIFGEQLEGLLYVLSAWAVAGTLYLWVYRFLPRRRLKRSRYHSFEWTTSLSDTGVSAENKYNKYQFQWDGVEVAGESRDFIYIQFLDFSRIVIPKRALIEAGLCDAVRDKIRGHVPDYRCTTE